MPDDIFATDNLPNPMPTPYKKKDEEDQNEIPAPVPSPLPEPTPAPVPRDETKTLNEVYAGRQTMQFNELVTGKQNPFADELNRQKSYRAESDQIAGMYADSENLGGLAPDVVTLSTDSIDPSLFKKIATNWKATAYLLDTPVDQLKDSDYTLYKKLVAAKLGKNAPKTENEYHAMLSQHFGKQKEMDVAVDELNMAAVMDALNATNYGENFPMVRDQGRTISAWMQKHPDLATPDRQWLLARSAGAIYNQTLSDIKDVQQYVAPTYKTLVDFTQGKATEDQLDNLGRNLRDLTPEQFNKVGQYVTLAAESQQIDRGAWAQLAKNLGESLSRGFDWIPAGDIFSGQSEAANRLKAVEKDDVWVPVDSKELPAGEYQNPRTARELPKYLQMASMGKPDETGYEEPLQNNWRKATPEEKELIRQNAEEGMKSMKMVRKLRNLAKTGVDPIKPLAQGGLLGAVERGAYGLAGSIPLMGAVAVNPFFGVLAYQQNELDRILLENEDMDLGAASTLALVEGGMNAVIDRFQIASLAGKSKVFGGVLKGMQKGGVANYLKRVGVIQTEQFLQENAQDLIAPVVETIAASLREDMPDKDFMAELGNYWETRPEVFFAVLPLALIGGGFASTGDLKNVNTEVTRERLRGAGISEEKIENILASETRAEMDERIKEAWQSRTEEDKARGLEYLNQQLQQIKQTDTDHNLAVERKEDGTAEWIVTDYTGQEVGRFADYDAAAEVISQNVVSNLTNEKTSIAELSQWVEKVGVLKDPKILLDQVPVSVAQDMERFKGIGDTKRLENLMDRLKFGDLQGKDPNKLYILGETTIEQVREGVYRAVIKLKENSSPRDAFEEINHGFFKVALANGTYTLDTYQKWLEQTEKATGRELKRATEMEVIESLAQVSEDWVMGRIDDTTMPQSFVDYIKRIAAIFKEALLRFVKMEQAFAKGEIDTDFQTALEQSLGIDPQVRLDRISEQTAAAVQANRSDTSEPAYSIRVQTTAANILADNLGIPKMVPKEYVGRQFILIEADLTAGGGSFTQKPAQGGPAWSVDPLNFEKGAAWASANDGFWTGKLNLAKESGAIYIGKDGREKFLIGTYAMLQTSHVSNPTVAGEKLAEVARYVREGRISPKQEAELSKLIRDAAQSIYDSSLAEKKKYENNKSSKEYERARQANTKASALINFPTSFTAQQLEQYIDDLSFDQRAFIATQLSTAQAEIIGAPPMGQITRATLDESFGGTAPLSLISLLEIDVKRLEEGLAKKTLTAESFGIVPHNSYASIAPGKIVTLFRTPIPYALAMPDIRKGLLDWDTKKKYVNNHGYFLKGRIPVGLPRTQTISAKMRDSWVKTQTNLRPNQAKAIVAALNQKWTRFERVNQAGLVEFPRALVNNDAAVTLTKYTFEEVKAMMKAGTMKVYRLGEMDVWFALKRLGEDEKDFGDPSKDWAIVSVVNNEKGASGMLPIIMSKALAEGGTILDCYAVKSTKYPDGLLPTLYARSGFEVTATLAFDPQYHTEAGKLLDLEQVWHSQKWDGIEKPPVVYMKWNPELHANIGTNADTARAISIATEDAGGMAQRESQGIGRVAEDQTGDMGGAGQGDQGGRISVSSSSTGDAGDARNILPRGIEQIVADLSKLNKYQLQALGLTKEEVSSAVAIYKSPTSVSYSVRDLSSRSSVSPVDGNDIRVIEGANSKVFGPALFSIRAFHGTPYDFDQFQVERIGTGEGAQAYGWGLYFAQNIGVANQYKNSVGRSPFDPRLKFEGEILSRGSLVNFYDRMDADAFDGIRQIMLDGKESEFNGKEEAALYLESIGRKKWADGIRNSDGLEILGGSGNLYSVDLDVEQDDLLDWDMPLSKQSEKVQTALAAMNPDYRQDSDEYDANEQGQMIYTRIPRGVSGNAKVASDALAAAGIKGIRYLDAGSRITAKDLQKLEELRVEVATLTKTISRNAGKDWEERQMFEDWLDSSVRDLMVLEEQANIETTYNFVMFDDSYIAITEKNGKPVSLKNASSYSIRKNNDADRVEFLSQELDSMYEAGGTNPRIGTYESELESLFQKIESQQQELESESYEFDEPVDYMEGDYDPTSRVLQSVEDYLTGRVDNETQTLADHLRGVFASEGPVNLLPNITDAQIEEGAMELYNNRLALRDQLAPNLSTPFYSIREQGEIDRVATAVEAVNRGPEGRLAVYQRAKIKFLQLMQDNKDALDAIKTAAVADSAPAIEKLEEDRASRLADIETEEIAEVESALQDNAVQFATRIEEAIDPEDKATLKADARDRAKILEKGIREKYSERKKQVEQEIAAEKRKTSEVSDARRVASNAVYKEKVKYEKLAQAVAELDGLLKVLPKEVIGKVGGFATLTKIGGGEKALADFFVKRVEMVDEQLERYLTKEYDQALDQIFERAKPKKAKAGEKPKGIGAEIQNLFAVLKEARDFNAREVSAHLAAIDDQIAKGELDAEEEAALMQEAALVTLVGNWKPKYQGYTDPTTGKIGYMKVDNGADSNRRATAVAALRETWARGYAEFKAREIAKREQRQADQQQAITSTGKKGDMKDRKEKLLKDAGLGAKFRNALFNLVSWDQFTGLLFGDNSPVANRLSDLQRRADNMKEDAIQQKTEAIEALFTRLAGGTRLDGEKLRWKMSQVSMVVDGLKLSELEGLTATMMWMQADGKRHMEGRFDGNGKRISAWGYTQSFIDQIEGALSDEAKEVRQFLLDNYDREYQRINAVYRQLNGIDLPRIQFYSPLIVSPQQAPMGMVNDPVTGVPVSAASVSPSSLRTRGTSIAEPNFRDALQTFIAHTKQMEHWMAYAPILTEVNGILRNREVQNSIQEKGGLEATRVLNLWLDFFAQGGNRDASNQLDLSKQISGMAGRGAQMALVGRLGTLLIQSTQLGAAVAEMPLGSYVVRLSKLLTGNLGWGEALNSPYIQRRIQEMPPVIQQAMEGLASKQPNRLKHEVARIGRLISGTDGLMTAGTFAIVFDYHFMQAKKMGFAEADARAYAQNVAERATDRLAQPTRMGSRSIFELTQTNAFAKVGWAFASEARKNLALAAYATANKPAGDATRTIAGLVFLNILFGALIRNAWRDARDEEDDEWFDERNWSVKRMLLAAATEPFNGLPFLGAAMNEGAYVAAGEYNMTGSVLSPSRAIRALLKTPDTLSGKRDIEDIMKDLQAMLSVMGLFDQNLAATTSLSTIAIDAFTLGKNAKKNIEQ